MSNNFLTLNGDKTEVLYFGPDAKTNGNSKYYSHQTKEETTDLSFESHMTKTALLSPRNVAKIPLF